MKNIKNVMLLAFCLSLTMPTVYAANWGACMLESTPENCG